MPRAFRLAAPGSGLEPLTAVKGSRPSRKNRSWKEGKLPMKCMTYLIALGMVSSFCIRAQKLETQSLDSTKIIRVETAADHLTVIEVNTPVTMVAVGNQGTFSVERRENKVFVKPVEEGARTNLFVWTTTGRFAYELVPAPSVEQMHFVIDQAPM